MLVYFSMTTNRRMFKIISVGKTLDEFQKSTNRKIVNLLKYIGELKKDMDKFNPKMEAMISRISKMFNLKDN